MKYHENEDEFEYLHYGSMLVLKRILKVVLMSKWTWLTLITFNTVVSCGTRECYNYKWMVVQETTKTCHCTNDDYFIPGEDYRITTGVHILQQDGPIKMIRVHKSFVVETWTWLKSLRT